MWKLPFGRLLLLSCLLLLASKLSACTRVKELLHAILNQEPYSRLESLSQFSDAPTSIARTFFSPAHKQAAQQIELWMKDAGMSSWIDAVGNVHGLVNGSDADAPAIVIGSHYDTVLDAGKYDGPLGIIVGISAVKAVLLQRLVNASAADALLNGEGNDVSIPAGLAATRVSSPIHVIAFSDEEGVRFQSTFLGSRAVAGTLLKYGMLAAKDKTGASLSSVLEAEGVEDVVEAVTRVGSSLGKAGEYVEVHIEQGPVLEARGEALGVVSAIAGQTRMMVEVTGVQGHAGTVPMVGRADSLAAAAALVSLIERRCGGGPGSDDKTGVIEGTLDGGVKAADEMLVCTVGELRPWPGASNVIAGSCQLSVDIRSRSDVLRREVVDNVTASIEEVCASRGVACMVRRTHDAEAVLADASLVARLVMAVGEAKALLDSVSPGAADSAVCGSNSTSEAEVGGASGSCGWSLGGGSSASVGEVPVMVSGAGHDAMAMAEVMPMGMLFVRCKGGVSHSPLESVTQDDVAMATAALAQYINARV